MMMLAPLPCDSGPIPLSIDFVNVTLQLSRFCSVYTGWANKNEACTLYFAEYLENY